MSYLSDYRFANSGSQCPESFWVWTALTLLGHLCGRKVYYNNGAFRVPTNLYTCLIGSPASGKSTARNTAENIITNHFDHLICAADMQTHGDIIKRLAADDSTKGTQWLNKATGQLEPCHSFFAMCDELRAFLHNDAQGMINFLVGIHDKKQYRDSYKNAGSNFIPNPHVSVLACGTPKWIMDELKVSILAYGLGRRLIMVVDEPSVWIPDPYKPVGWEAAEARVVDFLKTVHHETFQGEVTRSESGKQWWYDWYTKDRENPPDDPILFEFHGSKNVMLIKVAMLYAISQGKMVVDAEDFMFALALFDLRDKKVTVLSSGVGRNEINQYGAQLLERLKMLNGFISKGKMHKILCRDLRESEFEEVVKVLQQTGKLLVYNLTKESHNGIVNVVEADPWIVLPEKKDKFEGSWKEREFKNQQQQENKNEEGTK